MKHFFLPKTLLLFFSIFSCALPLSMKAQKSFYASTEGTNVRNEANIKSKKVDILLAGELVFSLDERSKDSTTITLGGKTINAHWQKVVTQSGQQGWVHEALLLGENPKTEYYAWVDLLRVRKEPNLKSEIIEQLRSNTVVFFSGQRSTHKDRIQIRQQNESRYWLEVETAAGNKGWVYGGGLKLKGKNTLAAPAVLTDPNKISADESKMLRLWWQGLKPEWQRFFNEKILSKKIATLGKTPTDTELQKIRSTKELDLSNNDNCNNGPFYSQTLYDLSGLAELTDLEKLYCDYISITDLQALKNLKKLRSLSVYQSNFSSLDGIEYLSSLQWLYIGNGRNEINFEKVGSLLNLEELSIETSDIEDFNKLINLSKLKKLIVNTNKLGSLQGIQSLANLDHLSIKAENAVLDLSPLTSLKKLDYLALYTKDLQKTEVLSTCTALSNLTIQAIELSFDAALLSNLPHLRELELRCAALKNEKELGKQGVLRALYLSHIDGFDFESIASCSQLWALEINSRRVLNLEKLGKFEQLSRLTIISDGIISLKELPMIASLQQLNIKSFNLSALDGIERFPKLLSLDFSECEKLEKIQAVNELKDLTDFCIPMHIPLENRRVLEIKRLDLDVHYFTIKNCQ